MGPPGIRMRRECEKKRNNVKKCKNNKKEEPCRNPTRKSQGILKTNTRLDKVSHTCSKPCNNNGYLNGAAAAPTTSRPKPNPCCSCTKFSTCALKPAGKVSGCSCLAVGRKCVNCLYKNRCANLHWSPAEFPPPERRITTFLGFGGNGDRRDVPAPSSKAMEEFLKLPSTNQAACSADKNHNEAWL